MKAARPVRILLTGFGPFPGMPYNPSGAVAEALARDPRWQRRLPGIDLAALVLPVLWDRTFSHAREADRTHKPHAIVHLGVARQATAFAVETRAINEIALREDNDGLALRAGPFAAGHPLIKHATLAAHPLIGALRRAGYPATLSRDAGRYLCNALMYSTLKRANGSVYPLAVFVHMPEIDPLSGAGPAGTLHDAINAARILVREAARLVVRAGRKSNCREGIDGPQTGYRRGQPDGGRQPWGGVARRYRREG